VAVEYVQGQAGAVTDAAAGEASGAGAAGLSSVVFIMAAARHCRCSRRRRPDGQCKIKKVFFFFLSFT
jgi:hypothetical protein